MLFLLGRASGTQDSLLIFVPLLRIGDEISSSSEFGRRNNLPRVRTLVKLGSLGFKLRRDAWWLLDLFMLAKWNFIRS